MPAADLLRILVVDDDRVDRIAVRRALVGNPLVSEVDEADDVVSGLAALDQGAYDCVLLDYNLPGGDGSSFLTQLKERGHNVPVIMLTGQSDTEVAVDLMKLGAADYLSKQALSGDRLNNALQLSIRLHRAEQAAKQADLRFRIVQEISPDGFIILEAIRSSDGKVVDFLIPYVNPAAAKLWNNRPEDVMGRTMLEIAPQPSMQELFLLYKTVLETGESREVETRLVHGEYDLWLRITAVKLGDGVAIGLGDITHRRRAEEEKERVLEGRNRFYAAMSHELRTPINAILGYNDLILAEVYGELPTPLRTSVERSQRATRQLLELVNDVLDLSKLEAGRMEVVTEEVSLPQIIQDLLATVQPLAAERDISLEVDDVGCRAPIHTDPRRLRQILLNLISNAIKYGRGMPVRIECSQTNGGSEIAVIDNGPGIPAEALPRIFEEFVQLPNANEGGTGLGLPISRGLAELLGGELTAESEVGRGSAFRLFLPRLAPGGASSEVPEQSVPDP